MTKRMGFLGIFISIILLTGCLYNETNKQEEYTDVNEGVMEQKIYYVTEDGTGLVSDYIELDSNLHDETLVREILDNVFHNNSINRENNSVFESIEVLDIDSQLSNKRNNSKRVNINLSEEYFDLDNDNISFRASIVYSLVELDNVNSVFFLVEGSDLSDAPLNKSSFNISVDGEIPSKDERFNLYFIDNETMKLRLYEKQAKYDADELKENFVLQLLREGPTDESGYAGTLSEEEEITIDSVKDGIAFVEVGSDFFVVESKEKEELKAYSVVNTLTELSNINKVQFTQDGMNVSVAGYENPLSSNLDIVTKEEED